MPAKGRRTASRQGQLKRKKTQKGPSGIPPADPLLTVPNGDTSTAVGEAELESSAARTTSSVTTDSTDPQTTRITSTPRAPRGEFVGQGPHRLRGERPASYLYVGAEFRRIALLTSVIFGALAVLGIVL